MDALRLYLIIFFPFNIKVFQGFVQDEICATTICSDEELACENKFN